MCFASLYLPRSCLILVAYNKANIPCLFCLISKLLTLGNIMLNSTLRRWILITLGEKFLILNKKACSFCLLWYIVFYIPKLPVIKPFHSFHTSSVCILFSCGKIMVRFLISINFWGEILIRGRSVFEGGVYFDLSINDAPLIRGRRSIKKK